MEIQPLVSIIINNYNYERFLSEAIDSALSQTYARTEVIVVDDNSTDNSCDVIVSYKDRVIPVFRKKNGKQAAALNSGFALSKGEIIIFLDADDYLLPEAVEQIVTVWNPKIAKVHYRLTVVDTSRQLLGFYYPPMGQPLACGEVWQYLLQVGSYNRTPTSGNAYNRKTLMQVLPIPDAYKTSADDYLMISTPFYGEVVGIEQPLGAYRIHSSNQWALHSVSGSRFRRFVQHDLQNFELLLQKAKEFGHQVPEDLELRSLGRLWSRLASLRLEPREHPISSDRPLKLIYWGLRSLWKYSSFNWQKRIIYSLWFFWVGLSPLPLAKLGITWLYAPQLRPKPVNWALTQIRILVS